MGTGSSGANVGNTGGSHDNGFPEVNGHSTELHKGSQGKHIPGHNNYTPGKGIIDGGMTAAQNLILEGAGKGMSVGGKKERVDFGRIIGTYKDLNGNSLRTTVGIICYSKKGAHIVPARPKGK